MAGNRGNHRDGPVGQIVDPAALGLPGRPVSRVELVETVMAEAAPRANVLSPSLQIDRIPPHHRVAFRVFWFDPADGRSWWRPQPGSPDLALTSNALDALARSAGARTGEVVTEILEHYVWRCVYELSAKGLDGEWSTARETRIVDLRTGSPEAEAAMGGNNSQKALNRARQHGAQLAAGKARARAIRKLLGVSQTYTPNQARLPFVLPILVFQPEEGTEVAAYYSQLLAQQAAGLFGPGQAPKPTRLADPGALDGDKLQGSAPALEDHGDPEPAPWERQERPRERVEAMPPRREAEAPPRRQERRQEPQVPTCDVCGRRVSRGVENYSRRHYDRVLCMDHQGGDA